MSVFWEKDGVLCWAVIERPQVHNAVDSGVMGRLEGLIEDLREDSSIRVLVLRGSGDAFVSGGDLREFSTLESAQEVAEMSRRMKRILEDLEGLDCWTVASINGDAYGGGCELALAFDFRIAVEGARLGFTQGRFAIPPGWGGLTRLVELVGRSRALKWLGQAAVVGAEEALWTGLVDEVVSEQNFDEHLEVFCGRLAQTPVELIKSLKEGSRRAQIVPRKESLEAELEPFCRLWIAEEHMSRVEKFLDE